MIQKERKKERINNFLVLIILLFPSMFNAQLIPPNLPPPLIGFVKPIPWLRTPKSLCPNGSFEDGSKSKEREHMKEFLNVGITSK